MFDTFFNPLPEFTAIDLSDQSVKIAHAQYQKRKAKLHGVARGDLPPGLVVEGTVQDSAALAKAIGAVLRTSAVRRLTEHAVAMTLPEEHCFIRTIRLPVMADKDFESAVRWEAEAAIPLPAGDAVVSWQIIGKTPDKTAIDVLVGGAPRSLAEGYVDTIRRIPLTPIAFEPESFAIARALLKPEDRDPLLIIDMGREHTGVIIAQDRVVRLTANIPIAARVLTERIAAAKKISAKDADELKRRAGIVPEGEGGAVRDILLPVLNDLVNQIREFFSYFETHGPASTVAQEEKQGKANTPPYASGTAIQRVLLTGGDAQLKGLPELFSEALRVPVNIGDPFRNFQHIPRKLDRHPLYTTVAGLALYPIDITSL